MRKKPITPEDYAWVLDWQKRQRQLMHELLERFNYKLPVRLLDALCGEVNGTGPLCRKVMKIEAVARVAARTAERATV